MEPTRQAIRCYPVAAARGSFGNVRPRRLKRGRSMGVLENALGPSPWYLRRGNPLVPGFKWEAAGESGQTAGAMVLAGRDGAVLILDFHNYVVLLDADTL